MYRYKKIVYLRIVTRTKTVYFMNKLLIHRSSFVISSIFQRILFVFITTILCWTTTVHAQELVASRVSTTNYYTFELPAEKNITAELEKLTPQAWKNHPDYGVLPRYAPCHNCVELIHKRTDSTRYFIENGTEGNKFYLQSGDETMHFRDTDGYIREQIHLMFPTSTPHVFRSMLQPEPLEIDIPQQQVTIYRQDGTPLSFNKNLELWALTFDGQKKRIATASWQNGYTAGANGVRVKNVFPNIDLEINNQTTGIKTNFVVKTNENQWQQYRYIFIKDDFFSGTATSCNFFGSPNDEQLYASDARVYDASNQPLGTIQKGVVYDAQQEIQRDVFYEWNNGFNIYVQTDIFNDPQVKYPITIDPTVQTTASAFASSHPGSKYASTCWDPNEYCSQNLTVTFPANATFTDVLISGGFAASWSSACLRTQGAMRYLTNGCISPINSTTGNPGFWNCSESYTPEIGYIYICWHHPDSINSFIGHLNTCLPAPACTTQTQVFSKQLFRCAGPNNGCSNCIEAYSPFTVTIVGETLALPSISINGGSGSTTICSGDTLVLKPNDDFGVPPYSYAWTPNGETTDSIIVSSDISTIYSLSVTDACGNTLSISQQITVIKITHDTLKQVICQSSLPYTWQGHTVTTTGQHELVDTTTVAGCHSTKTLLLTVYPDSTSYNVTICDDALPYVWESHTVTTQGEHTLINPVVIEGCPTTATMNLTVDPVMRLHIDSALCTTDFPFVWQGQSVFELGSYILHDTTVAANGCDSITSLYLFLQCDIEPPNIITLSSKQGNDVWFIEDGGFASFHCEISDRWGNIIYELNDVSEKWKGENKQGKQVTEGVYFYLVKVSYKDGRDISKHGFIHVSN